MSNYLSRAIFYIEENGDELERARLGGLLGRDRPDPKATRALLTRQNEDGGFPYQMVPGRPSAITATAAALQWMADLRVLRTPHAERAVAYLLTEQRPTGSWEESPALMKFTPPPLARPGDLAGRAYATALSAFWLSRLLGHRHEGVQRAFGFLRKIRDDGWPDDEPVQVSSLVTSLSALVDGPASSLAAAGVDALARRASDAWSADRLADVFGALYAAGFAGDVPLVAWGLRRLMGLQQDEGGWSSEYGADHDVDLSLRALRALLAFGISAA
ncbi:MAG: prenyltransferase/squalene oxidase repeat-containing protein [bacterium]